jgi:DNA-binding response OmpR family regulator
LDTVNILLVDDSDADAFITKKIIQRSNVASASAELSRAKSKAEMLTLLATNEYQCVLLDLGLPDSQGDDTVTAACEAAGDTPVILLSGGDQISLDEFAKRGGAASAIVKKHLADADDILQIVLSTINNAASK